MGSEEIRHRHPLYSRGGSEPPISPYLIHPLMEEGTWAYDMPLHNEGPRYGPSLAGGPTRRNSLSSPGLACERLGSRRNGTLMGYESQPCDQRDPRRMAFYMYNGSSNSTATATQGSDVLREKVVSLLREVPNQKLPLFQLREIYEKRYQSSIGVSELYRLKDILSVKVEDSGRMVQLLVGGPSGDLSSYVDSNALDPSFCPLHSSPENSRGWAERENESKLPFVDIRLSELAKNIKIVVDSHGGCIPFASLLQCYNADIQPALVTDNDRGIPLEHLLSCLKGFFIHVSESGNKSLYILNEETETLKPSNNKAPASSSLQGQHIILTREFIELLKGLPAAVLPFSHFIPAYHRHFGRQCRVSDYGCTRLRDVMDSIPQTVQLIGEGGSKLLITLSHRCQMKRFTSDLLRVLKTQVNKTLVLKDLPRLFEEELANRFDVRSYGVCYLEDLILEVTDSSILLSLAEIFEESKVYIFHREQTQLEKERTRRFARDVVELLRHVPHFSILFTKFIPSYHHHFGRQCRVADYGFNKLIDLLEVIPETVSLSDNGEGERVIHLVAIEVLGVLRSQLTSILQKYPLQNTETLGHAYLKVFGYPLRPEAAGVNSLVELLELYRDHGISTTTREDGSIRVYLNGQEARPLEPATDIVEEPAPLHANQRRASIPNGGGALGGGASPCIRPNARYLGGSRVFQPMAPRPCHQFPTPYLQQTRHGFHQEGGRHFSSMFSNQGLSHGYYPPVLQPRHIANTFYNSSPYAPLAPRSINTPRCFLPASSVSLGETSLSPQMARRSPQEPIGSGRRPTATPISNTNMGQESNYIHQFRRRLGGDSEEDFNIMMDAMADSFEQLTAGQRDMNNNDVSTQHSINNNCSLK